EGSHAGGRARGAWVAARRAWRPPARGGADSLARRSGRIRQLVWRVSRATDAPLLVTAPLRAGDEACPASVTSGGVGGGARVHMDLASLAPPRGASVMPATPGCPACAHGVGGAAGGGGALRAAPCAGQGAPAAARRAT